MQMDIYQYMYEGMFITWRVESAWKILRTKLKKGSDSLGKTAIDMLDSMIEKWLQILRPKERNKDLHAASLVNIYQGTNSFIQTKLLNTSTHGQWM